MKNERRILATQFAPRLSTMAHRWAPHRKVSAQLKVWRAGRIEALIGGWSPQGRVAAPRPMSNGPWNRAVQSAVGLTVRSGSRAPVRTVESRGGPVPAMASDTTPRKGRHFGQAPTPSFMANKSQSSPASRRPTHRNQPPYPGASAHLPARPVPYGTDPTRRLLIRRASEQPPPTTRIQDANARSAGFWT